MLAELQEPFFYYSCRCVASMALDPSQNIGVLTPTHTERTLRTLLPWPGDSAPVLRMIRFNAVGAALPPTVHLHHESHRVEGAIKLRPVTLWVRVCLLPKCCIVCQPAATTAPEGLPHQHSLIRQHVLYPLGVLGCHHTNMNSETLNPAEDIRDVSARCLGIGVGAFALHAPAPLCFDVVSQ